MRKSKGVPLIVWAIYAAVCVVPLALVFLLLFKSNPIQRKYGHNSSYFMALSSLEKNDEKTAERLFIEAERKASPLIARRAMENLSRLGGVQDKIEKSLSLYKRFPDEDSLLLSTKELFSSNEYAKIIMLTEKLSLSDCDNEIAFYRLYSMSKKKDPRLQEEFFSWCTNRSFQKQQYKLYCELSGSGGESKQDKLLDFRADVYQKKYDIASEKVKEILSEKDFQKPQIMSDAGKALLYGSENFLSNALYFDSIKKSLPEECKFYADFYAGRLYDKVRDNYQSRSSSRFLSAAEEACSDERIDNALWYYFNSLLKTSAKDAVMGIEKHKDKIKNPSYYEDFFETLSVRLFALQSWEDFYHCADLFYGKLSPETSAKFCYIAARLIQEGYIHLPEEKRESEVRRLFTQSLESGNNLYYKFSAMAHLNMSKNEIEEAILGKGKTSKAEEKNMPDIEAEKLLLGYAEFGLASYIYPEYQRLKDKIGKDCAEKLATFLYKCGRHQESIRIASYAFLSSNQKSTKELTQLAFPQDFENEVSSACQDFSQPEELLYALIRSESFFNPEAVSSVGAIGLTQLMSETAEDIARKLKVANYDLKDSEANIRFGSFYLEELRRRLEGSSLLAVLSYNGGITRVRSWIKSAQLEFGTSSLPMDLFLEGIPFEETREYGRKVVSACAMYGWLYYEKTPGEVVEEMMK